MALVTYVPRYLPFRFLDPQRVPGKLRVFLHQMPYAALGALILPGAFCATEGSHVPAVGAAIVCAVVAGLTKSTVASLISAVLTAALLLFYTN